MQYLDETGQHEHYANGQPSGEMIISILNDLNNSQIQLFLGRRITETDKGLSSVVYITNNSAPIQSYKLLYCNVLLGYVRYGNVPMSINVSHSDLCNAMDIIQANNNFEDITFFKAAFTAVYLLN